jgi:hypothetical protein
MKKLISVTTDGAPAMVERRLGLIGLLMADNDFPDFQAYHCIIHQQALCSKLKDDALKNVMDIVVKIVNFIRANPLKHRQFKTLLGLRRVRKQLWWFGSSIFILMFVG